MAGMGAVLAAGLMLTGCGKGAPKAGPNAFNAAPPPTKEVWEKAVAADAANDYVAAAGGYRQLMLQGNQLSPDQFKAVYQASGKLSQRAMIASSKGDPAARQAVSQLRPPTPASK